VRFGVLSDIHGNWHAFQAALATLDREGVDEIVCLGDVVGYGADPVACVEEIVRRKITTIRGNHERYVIGEIDDEVKDITAQSIEWTRAQLKNDHYQAIESWENRRLHRDLFLMTHGSPRNKDEYILSLDAVIANLRIFQKEFPAQHIALHGHTHITSVYAPGQVVNPIHQSREVELDMGKIYLINPGSVGQPRDRCPLSSFLILDFDRKVARFFREEYDVAGAQKKIRDAGLAEKFASRLAEGA
jgi:predicted phosphodiesterase